MVLTDLKGKQIQIPRNEIYKRVLQGKKVRQKQRGGNDEGRAFLCNEKNGQIKLIDTT